MHLINIRNRILFNWPKIRLIEKVTISSSRMTDQLDIDRSGVCFSRFGQMNYANDDPVCLFAEIGLRNASRVQQLCPAFFLSTEHFGVGSFSRYFFNVECILAACACARVLVKRTKRGVPNKGHGSSLMSRGGTMDPEIQITTLYWARVTPLSKLLQMKQSSESILSLLAHLNHEIRPFNEDLSISLGRENGSRESTVS